MSKLSSIIQVTVGILLMVLVVNDFVELLFEYLFNVSNLKLPITFSKGGWEVKYWLMDNGAFSIYQVVFMATGMAMLIAGISRCLSQRILLVTVIMLIASALFVILFPDVHYIVQETPHEFMYAQIIAALAILPIALNKKRLALVNKVLIIIAVIISSAFLLVSIIKTPITLWFAILPAIGSYYLLFIQSKKTT